MSSLQSSRAPNRTSPSIAERIDRRRGRSRSSSLIRDFGVLSPTVHVEEPAGRGRVFERLLDHLEPIFDGRLPSDAYLHGPRGSGKSEVLTALFAHLRRFSAERGSIGPASARAARSPVPEIVRVDLRGTTSEFSVYRDLLDALVEASIPEHGVSTADLRDRLHDRLRSSPTGAVVAVDHVGEPGGLSADRLVEVLTAFPSEARWLAVGRTPPEEAPIAGRAATSIRVDRYRPQMLVDVVLTRAAEGLVGRALTHELARRVADWADGNAHDALAAIAGAAVRAERAGATTIRPADVEAGIEAVPTPSVSLGRALSLPPARRRVLAELVRLDERDRGSVNAAADAIATADGVSLSASTVRRHLYEFADAGLVERVTAAESTGTGRPPSRLVPRFPTIVFRELSGGDDRTRSVLPDATV